MSKITRYTEFSPFATDSELSISIANFEYLGFFSRYKDDIQSRRWDKLLGYKDESGSIFFCQFKNPDGQEVVIINRGGSDKILSRIIPDYAIAIE